MSTVTGVAPPAYDPSQFPAFAVTVDVGILARERFEFVQGGLGGHVDFRP